MKPNYISPGWTQAEREDLIRLLRHELDMGDFTRGRVLDLTDRIGQIAFLPAQTLEHNQEYVLNGNSYRAALTALGFEN